MTVEIQHEIPSREETLDLYAAVGWVTYTQDPDALMAALEGSSYVLTARNDEGVLVGLVRVISDGSTIAYVQDILVDPRAHRTGVGSALLDEVMARSADIRQLVLLTDADPVQRLFYESRGMVEIHDVEPQPLRSFVRLL
ncbi:GNAT family N-acetyltransferase [Timonella sp. A28]|uniref:GNAT family N-acetyltransferase n=1 Tax=Timonella sp. A28 TaxID=3442640 RepID=UPI003EBC7066